MSKLSPKFGRLLRALIVLTVVVSVLVENLYEIRIPKPPHITEAFGNKILKSRLNQDLFARLF
jgi:hypothetical protein